MLIFRLIKESFSFALSEIFHNKVRTVLSLLGITIGIFCIISVFTVFDSLELSVKSSINSLGSNTLYIQKWPWSMGGDYPWWKYINRPQPNLNDLRIIKKSSNTVEACALEKGFKKNVKYRNNNISSTSIVAVSQDYDKVNNFSIHEGRYFSSLEFNSGRPNCVIGRNIKNALFKNIDPIGKKIKIFGSKIQVIGVFEKQGESNFGNSTDDVIMIPVNLAKKYVNMRWVDGQIVVKSKPNISNEEMKNEIKGILRSYHKIRPKDMDDFAINETDIISKGFSSFFSIISLVGWIIGGFSLLVGGFGVANIMFVSVKERTRIIGIQKSVGAKKYFILFQFLFESLFLSLMGGIFGLIIIFILTLLVSYSTEMKLILTADNIMLGIIVSSLIGLVSGLIPARTASNLNPVEAMRSTF